MNVTTTRKRIMNALPFVLCFCFLLISGTALAQKVTLDYDKEADFSKYKTYAFGRGTPAPETLMDQRIREAIATQLAAKGLTKVESNPDLFVVYHCATTNKHNSTPHPWAAGVGGQAGDDGED